MDHHEELISAYVDGELTDEEQRQVKQLLSEDEAARQLFAEFQSLRSSFRALPADPVDHEFSKEVLERVEQVSSEQSRVTALPARQEPREPTFRLRTLLWPAMAIAAAIMLMVFYEEPTSNDQKSRESVSQNGLLARLPETTTAPAMKAPKESAMMAKPQQQLSPELSPAAEPPPIIASQKRAFEGLEMERAEVVENPDTLVDTEVKSQITNAPALTQADTQLLEKTGKAIAQLKVKQPAGIGGSSGGPGGGSSGYPSDGPSGDSAEGLAQKREAITDAAEEPPKKFYFSELKKSDIGDSVRPAWQPMQETKLPVSLADSLEQIATAGPSIRRLRKAKQKIRPAFNSGPPSSSRQLNEASRRQAIAVQKLTMAKQEYSAAVQKLKMAMRQEETYRWLKEDANRLAKSTPISMLAVFLVQRGIDPRTELEQLVRDHLPSVKETPPEAAIGQLKKIDQFVGAHPTQYIFDLTGTEKLISRLGRRLQQSESFQFVSTQPVGGAETARHRSDRDDRPQSGWTEKELPTVGSHRVRLIFVVEADPAPPSASPPSK